MYENKIHFGKLLLKQSETVLAHLTPVTSATQKDVWTKIEEGR